MRPAAAKNFYLRLTIEKIRAFMVFTKKYLRSHDRSGTNFTTVAKLQIK